jgi:hypothetical protein
VIGRSSTSVPERCRADVTVCRDMLVRRLQRFVTPIVASVASGWSSCRVDLALALHPLASAPFFTAHAKADTERRALHSWMRTLYGFSKSVRNPDLSKAKKQLTMLLDETRSSTSRLWQSQSGKSIFNRQSLSRHREQWHAASTFRTQTGVGTTFCFELPEPIRGR